MRTPSAAAEAAGPFAAEPATTSTGAPAPPSTSPAAPGGDADASRRSGEAPVESATAPPEQSAASATLPSGLGAARAQVAAVSRRVLLRRRAGAAPAPAAQPSNPGSSAPLPTQMPSQEPGSTVHAVPAVSPEPASAPTGSTGPTSRATARLARAIAAAPAGADVVADTSPHASAIAADSAGAFASLPGSASAAKDPTALAITQEPAPALNGDRPRLRVLRSPARAAESGTSPLPAQPAPALQAPPGNATAALLARATGGAIEYEDDGRVSVLLPPPGSVTASPGGVVAREATDAPALSAQPGGSVAAAAPHAAGAAAAAAPGAATLDRDELYADFMRRLRRDVLEQREQLGEL
jgi:hypothetical protein